jgi:hypothetical protein
MQNDVAQPAVAHSPCVGNLIIATSGNAQLAMRLSLYPSERAWGNVGWRPTPSFGLKTDKEEGKAFLGVA